MSLLDTNRPLSGPGSTRPLTSSSGRMKNSARRLLRQGFRGAAQEMALGAETQRLQEIAARGGRGIRSDDEMAAEQRYAVRAAQARAIQREQSMRPEADMDGEFEGPSAGTGVPRGVRPTGTPPAGTPPAGTPPAGTPPAGTPPAGTPPAGTPPTALLGGDKYTPKFVSARQKALAGTGREETIQRMLKESSASGETRSSAMERINKERVQKGLPPISVDWEKEVAALDAREASARTAQAAAKAGAASDYVNKGSPLSQFSQQKRMLARQPTAPLVVPVGKKTAIADQTAAPPVVSPGSSVSAISPSATQSGPPISPASASMTRTDFVKTYGREPEEAPSFLTARDRNEALSREKQAKIATAQTAARDSRRDAEIARRKKIEDIEAGRTIPSVLRGTIAGGLLTRVQRGLQ